MFISSQRGKLIGTSVVIFSGLAFLLASSYFKQKQKKNQDIQKNFLDKQLKREVEIRLIQKKAAELYVNECKNNGLVIIEAYYGSSQIIDELVFVQDKITFLEQNQQKKKKIIDVTIPLRFQVIDSNLTLYGNSKKHLFGFYNPCDPHEKNSLYLR